MKHDQTNSNSSRPDGIPGKLMLIYPPGRVFMRGEERCQSNIDASTSTAMRACNDLGYVAAVMRNEGWSIFLRDYQGENATRQELIADFKRFLPDVLFMSVTNSTLLDDLSTCSALKKEHPALVLVLKGAVFFNPPKPFLERPELAVADFLIAEEAEYVIDALLVGKAPATVPGIHYRDESGAWIASQVKEHCKTLDDLPFPARDLMPNHLYVRPDTGAMQATISTSRGCPSACRFCLTPYMSGRVVRKRSPESIVREIVECVEVFGITEFFFRADTFTIDKRWVLELCRLFQEYELVGKISWVANSRAVTLDDEMLVAMKGTGCWLLAIGFESGSEETLIRAKKGTTPLQNRQTAALVHKHGVKLFGFYMIGFPWENMNHLEETRRLIYDTKPDFIELHLVTPFYGTSLFEEFQSENLLKKSVVGCDYFETVPFGTRYLSGEQLMRFRCKVLRQYLFSPGYLFRRLREALTSPVVFWNYTVYALKLVHNLWRKR